MKRDELKSKVCNKIEKNKDEIINVVQQIYHNPEIGYREHESTAIVKRAFKSLNLKTKDNIAVTGLKASISSKEDIPHLAVLGELDALICKDHPDAEVKTKAVHACGHNNQIGIMLGVAYGLIKTNIFKELSGKIDFMAVPAEEYIDIKYRNDLIEKGEISYLSGKQELIKRGYFDDIDIVIMAHSMDLGDFKDAVIGPTGSGFIYKKIDFENDKNIDGNNIVYNTILKAINNQNSNLISIENKKQDDFYKNIDTDFVENDLNIRCYVKGKTVKEILNTSEKLDKIIKNKVKPFGIKVSIENIPGYLPLLNYNFLMNILEKNLEGIIDSNKVIKEKSFKGAFDIGDLSHFIPALHPFFSGVEGRLHSKNFKTIDYDLAVIKPAKILAKTIIDILIDRDKILNHLGVSPYSKEEYLAILSEMNSN